VGSGKLAEKQNSLTHLLEIQNHTSCYESFERQQSFPSCLFSFGLAATEKCFPWREQCSSQGKTKRETSNARLDTYSYQIALNRLRDSLLGQIVSLLIATHPLWR
jgi:hypothetical protein